MDAFISIRMTPGRHVLILHDAPSARQELRLELHWRGCPFVATRMEGESKIPGAIRRRVLRDAMDRRSKDRLAWRNKEMDVCPQAECKTTQAKSMTSMIRKHE